MGSDVFISYSKYDKPAADAVCASLESSGVRCWIAPRDILPGLDYGEAIIDAIGTVRAMVLIFSSHANDSPQIRREIERAVNKDIPIIPVRIENVAPNTKLEYFISSNHWFDAITPPIEQHMRQLAQSVVRLLNARNRERVCPKCQTVADAEARFCDNCGHGMPSLAEVEAAAEAQEREQAERESTTRWAPPPPPPIIAEPAVFQPAPPQPQELPPPEPRWMAPPAPARPETPRPPARPPSLPSRRASRPGREKWVLTAIVAPVALLIIGGFGYVLWSGKHPEKSPATPAAFVAPVPANPVGSAPSNDNKIGGSNPTGPLAPIASPPPPEPLPLPDKPISSVVVTDSGSKPKTKADPNGPKPAGTTARQAGVMSVVPANAQVVVCVRKLQSVSDRLGRFFTSTGLSAMSPELEKPLAYIEKTVGVKRGLDRNGEMAFAIVDLDENPDHSGVMVLPITDYNDFLGSFADVKFDGPIAHATNAEGETIYAINAGKFAVLSPDKALVTSKPTGLVLPAFAAKEMQSRDVVVYAKAQPLRDSVMKAAELPQPTGVPETDAIVDGGRRALKLLFDDAQSFTVSVDVQPEGIAATLAVDFRPDSGLGQLVRTLPGTKSDLMTGLPDTDYFVCGGMILSPATSVKLIDMISPPGKGAAAEDALGVWAQGFRSMAGVTKQASFGLAQPKGPPGSESILQMMTVARGDVAAMHRAQFQFLDAEEKFTSATTGPLRTQLQVSGNSTRPYDFGQFTKTMSADENDPAGQQALMVENMVYGRPQFSGTFGAVNADTYATLSGVGAPLQRSALASAKAGKDVITPRPALAATTRRLPSQRFAAVYVSLDNVIKTGLQYSKELGIESNLNLPNSIPPIGITLGAEGAVLRADAWFPSQAIDATVRTAVEMENHSNREN